MTQMAQFSLGPCKTAVVSAGGLALTDTMTLWRKACPEKTCPGDGTDIWIPFSPKGCSAGITLENNPLLVNLPGEYRVMFDGIINPDVTVCVDEVAQCCASSQSCGC